MLRHYMMNGYCICILVLSMMTASVHAISLFKGPTPQATRVQCTAIPAEAILRKRIEYKNLIPLSDTYRLFALLQTDVMWNLNPLNENYNIYHISELILPFSSWVNAFITYEQFHELQFFPPAPADHMPTKDHKNRHSDPNLANLSLVIGNLSKFPIYGQVGILPHPGVLHDQKVFSPQLAYISNINKVHDIDTIIVGGGIGFSFEQVTAMFLIGRHADDSSTINSFQEVLQPYGLACQYRWDNHVWDVNLGGGVFYPEKANILRPNISNIYMNIAKDMHECFIEYGYHNNKAINNRILYAQYKANYAIYNTKGAGYIGFENGSMCAKEISNVFIISKIQFNQFFNVLAGARYNLSASKLMTEGSMLDRWEGLLQFQLSF